MNKCGHNSDGGNFKKEEKGKEEAGEVKKVSWKEKSKAMGAFLLLRPESEGSGESSEGSEEARGPFFVHSDFRLFV